MRQELIDLFPELSDLQLNQYEKLLEIFPVWNDKVNCVSRKDISNLFVNHVLHSLSIAMFFRFPPNSRVADVGTGGGFPGIPLAIMFPEIKFDLIDSIGKKVNVVSNIANELGLTNITAIKSRAELLPCHYDFVVSRAVTAFPSFVQIVRGMILGENSDGKQGILYLKGGDFDDELKGFSNYSIYNIRERLDYEYFDTKKIIYLPISKKKLKKVFD